MSSEKRIWDLMWRDKNNERNAAAGFPNWVKVGIISEDEEGRIRVFISPHVPFAFVTDITARSKGMWLQAYPHKKEGDA